MGNIIKKFSFKTVTIYLLTLLVFNTVCVSANENISTDSTVVNNGKELYDALLDSKINLIKLNNSIDFSEYFVSAYDADLSNKEIDGNGYTITGGHIETNSIKNTKLMDVFFVTNSAMDVDATKGHFVVMKYGNNLKATEVSSIVTGDLVENSIFLNCSVYNRNNSTLNNIKIENFTTPGDYSSAVINEAKNVTYKDVVLKTNQPIGISLCSGASLNIEGTVTFDGPTYAAITSHIGDRYASSVIVKGEIKQIGNGYTIYQDSNLNVSGNFIGYMKTPVSQSYKYYNTPYREGNAPSISKGEIVGDLNSDKMINIIDISVAASKYNIQSGSEKYSTSCDFDTNGIIDIYDIVSLAKYCK